MRLPRSPARRGATTYVLVLSLVYPRWRQFPWEGKHYAPGARVERTQLPDLNGQQLAIECVGSEKPGYGHNREPSLYLLWHLAPGCDEWRELARASGLGAEWTYVLHAAALAQLARAGVDPRLARDAAHRVIVALESELERLGEARDRADVCATLHDRVLYQLLRASEYSKSSTGAQADLLSYVVPRPQ